MIAVLNKVHYNMKSMAFKDKQTVRLPDLSFVIVIKHPFEPDRLNPVVRPAGW